MLVDDLLNINKEFKSLKKLVISTNYIYKNELDKACFAHDAACSDSKDLKKRTAADKILRNRAFNIAKDPKYDEYQRGLAPMVYKFFYKKSKGSGGKHVNTKLTPQKQLKNFINPLLKNWKKEKYTQHLKIIFGVLI